MTNLSNFVDETSVDVNGLFENTDYQVGHVLSKLYENSPKFVELIGSSKIVKVEKEVIGKDKGYTSYVYRTVLHFNDTTKPKLSFVCKIPTLDVWKNNTGLTEVETHHNAIRIREIHNYECIAYNLLKDLKGFSAPESYYLENASPEKAGLIVMEDLSKNSTSAGLYFTVTKQLCFNLARHIADFQVHGDFMHGKPWKEQFVKNMHTIPVVIGIWMKMIRNILEYDNKELKDKVNTILKIDFYSLSKYTTEERAEELGCTTLVHGDMWTNNMLIKLGDDGSTSDEILGIVDWQNVFPGNPLFDIARFISTCADAEIRREHENELVDFYYDYLTTKYKERGSEPNFTKEQAHELYELGLVQETWLLCVMFGCLCYPMFKSKGGVEQAKCKKLALRLNLLFDDALPLIEKYKLDEKFKLNDTQNPS